MQGSVGDLLLIRGRAGDGTLLAPRLSAQVAPIRDTEAWPFWQRGGQRVTLERWGRLNWSDKASHWKDESDFRGPRDVESPRDDWTQVECLCDGGHLLVTVNGTVVNEAFDVHPRAGGFCCSARDQTFSSDGWSCVRCEGFVGHLGTGWGAIRISRE